MHGVINMKKCTKCFEVKDERSFHKCRTCRGGIRNECKQCRNAYRDSKRDRVKSVEMAKAWRLRNIDKVIKYKKSYRERENELSAIRRKKCLAKHREKDREYAKARRSSPMATLENRIRANIGHHFARMSTSKSSKLVSILGCSLDEFREHLEKTFSDNYGDRALIISEVEIDHIIPLSTAKSVDDLYRLNRYTNLQLLTKKDNRAKGCKLNFKIKGEKT